MNPPLTQLKRQLETLMPRHDRDPAHGRIALGVEDMDAQLKGGLPLGLLHEVYAGKVADMAATHGFAAALTHKIAACKHPEDNRPVVWIRQTMSEHEMGRLYPHGLASLGFDPAQLITVRVNKARDLLSAGLEATRCNALAGVLIEAWANPKELDLTATRRLALAAEQSGATPLLLRVATQEQPSAAFTRWQVHAAPSRALAANAPGHPTFDVTLLRNKAGTYGQSWRLEWHHDLGQFRSLADRFTTQNIAEHWRGAPAPYEPLSGRVVPLPARRPVAASARRAATG